MRERYYLGIDLDDKNAVISFFGTDQKEPETLSLIAGSEMFQIPLLLTKKKGIGQWFIGEEAVRLRTVQGDGDAGMLLSRAMRQETVFIENESYPAEELLALFLKKLLLLPGRLGGRNKPDRLVISLEKLSHRAAQLFAGIADKIGLAPEQISLVDRNESFYYFAYSQTEELWLHDVCLFDYRGDEMICCRLERSLKTTPQLITLTEERRRMDGMDRDAAFLQILQDCFRGYIVSSVYLIGDGFDEHWMKNSLAFMCRGRRAFIGKNLYSKGACYAAAIKDSQTPWQFVYMGENELKVNVSLKVLNGGKPEFLSLLSAGENWYETQGCCEVILVGTPEIDFWLQLPNSREAKVEKLALMDLPERPQRTSRIRITAKPLSDRSVQIKICDLGFGEIFPASEKTWEYVMSLPGGA